MTRILTFLFCVYLPLCAVAGSEIGLANLPKDDRVKITFTSNGCFNYSTHVFTFVGGSSSIEIEKIIRQFSEKEQKLIDKETKKLGEIQLTKEDFAKLDALLSFYRKGSQGGSTTTDEVKMVQIHNGKEIKTEEYLDRSSQVSEMKDVLSFQELISRLKKPHKWGQSNLYDIDRMEIGC